MQQLIYPYISRHNISIESFDIDQELTLLEKYHLLVPVLTDMDDNEICHHFFDKVSFERILEGDDY